MNSRTPDKVFKLLTITQKWLFPQEYVNCNWDRDMLFNYKSRSVLSINETNT